MTPLEELVIKTVRRVISETVFTGTVVSVDKDQKTCKVDDDGLERPAKLMSADYGGQDFMVAYPKVGSVVTCTVLNNDPAQLQVINYTAVEEWVFNGGQNGGIIVYQELLKEYNKTRQVLDSILQVINGSQVPEPGSGAPSALQTALKVALQGKSSGDFSLSKIINQKMKH